MSAVTSHSFLESEYFAGFGIRNDSDLDFSGRPSSSGLLTCPYSVSVLPRHQGFSSSPNGYLNYTPGNVVRNANKTPKNDYLTGINLSPEFKCQVRLINDTPSKQPDEKVDDASCVNTNANCSILDRLGSPPPSMMFSASLLPDPVSLLRTPALTVVQTTFGPTKPGTPSTPTNNRPSSASSSTTSSPTRISSATPSPSRNQSPVERHMPETSLVPPESPLAPPEVHQVSSGSSSPVHTPEFCSVPRSFKTNSDGKVQKRIRVIQNLRMPSVTQAKPFVVKILDKMEGGPRDPVVETILRKRSSSKASEVTDSEPTVSRPTLPIFIRFEKRKAFFIVVSHSESAPTYRLPVFTTLLSMSELLSSPACQVEEPMAEDSEVISISHGRRYSIALSRFESRLTLTQLAHLLGLSGYSINVTRYVESAVIQLFNELTNLDLNVKRWTKLSKKDRLMKIHYVSKFSRAYFPTITNELLDIIMRRASYAGAQQHLKSQRLARKMKAMKQTYLVFN